MEKVMKILMIGNSYCFYFCDELYAIAHADGVEMKVANLYINGGMTWQHYEQLTKNEPLYWYVVNDKNGRERIKEFKILDALAAEDWDVVTNQESYHPGYSLVDPNAGDETCRYAKLMFDYCKDRFPTARHLWQAVWAKEVGFMGAYAAPEWKDNIPEEDEVYLIRTKEKQTFCYEVIRDNAIQVCKENNVDMIPTGLAWQIAREDPRVGDHLCMPDKNHDGEEGGGQYLNACVWYEVLTKRSCLGNPWRPEYDLPEQKVIALQQCAHKAVACVFGEDYAK